MNLFKKHPRKSKQLCLRVATVSSLSQRLVLGFTLIELMLVVAVVGVLSAFGAGTFNDYAATKRVSTAADEIASVLNLAKTRAISQVKPSSCGNAELDGYRVVFCSGGCSGGVYTYVLQAYCGGNGVVVGNPYTLPQGVTLGSTAQQTVLFRTLSGIAEASSDIVVSSKGKTKTISVTRNGVIATTGLLPITPTAAPTPSPTVTPPPTPVTITSFAPAQSSLVQPNTGTTLSWSVSGTVTSCTGSGGWSGDQGFPTGTYNTGVLTTTTIYTLTCDGPATPGGVSQPTTVTVVPAPTLNFLGSAVIFTGSSVNLSWTTANATTCTGSGGNAGWVGSRLINGTYSTSTGAAYTLNCAGSSTPNAQATDTVSVLTGTDIKAFASPTTQTLDSTTGWKNICVYISGSQTIKGVGIYVAGASAGGFPWRLYKTTDSVSNCTGPTTFITSSAESGLMSEVVDSVGYYNAKLVTATNFCSCSWGKVLLQVNVTSGSTYRSSVAQTVSSHGFNYYSTGDNIGTTNAGTYAIRIIY